MRSFVSCVLDRSGSMGSDGKIEEAIGGFNKFLREQKSNIPEAELLVTIFDDSVDEYYRGKLKDCPELTEKVFFPRGMTRLNDAIGETIAKTLASSYSDEDKGIILVITDGAENSSREYGGDAIKSMIQEGKDKGWDFIFLGCDASVIGQAQDFGFRGSQYDDSSDGVRIAYTSMVSDVTSYFHSAQK